MKTYDELVKENEGLKERGQKVIESLHETIDKQKAEIERLTEENGWLSKECNRSTTECAELQKQVDELTVKVESYQHSFEYNQGYEDGKQQAVKDTAKEVLEMYRLEDTFSSFQEKVAKKYGVEVE